MSKTVYFAVCDVSEDYARKLCDYIRMQDFREYEFAVFTSAGKLDAFEKKEEIHTLLVSEEIFSGLEDTSFCEEVFVLSEKKREEDNYIYKYQSADRILSQILANHKSGSCEHYRRKLGEKKTHFIGFYSPVHRTYQTTTAIAVGQQLAGRGGCLYLSFESYRGNVSDFRGADLSDLLYYLENSEDNFGYRLRSLTSKLGELDYIEPSFSYQDVAETLPETWLKLFNRISTMLDYEYVVLDLSDNMRGLFEILGICERIFTMVAKDAAAENKLMHFEELVERMECKELLEKTVRICNPYFKDVPPDPELLQNSAYREYALGLIEEHL